MQTTTGGTVAYVDQYKEHQAKKDKELLEQILRALKENPELTAKLKIALRGHP